MFFGPRLRVHPLVSWLSTSFALLAGDELLDNVFLNGLPPALAAAAVLGVINIFIRPVVVAMTLPITFLTLGLFTFVINAFLLTVVAWVVPGFGIQAIHSAIALAVIVSIVHGTAAAFFGEPREEEG